MNSLITLHNGVATTTSLKVAEFFKKDHSKVLRLIRSLEDNGANFGLVNYQDAKGENRPMYSMNKTNFTLLAMSFTGKKAIKFKIDYIKAFEAMERQLMQPKVLSRKEILQMALAAEEKVEKLEKENARLASRNLEVKTQKEYKWGEKELRNDQGRTINYYVHKYFNQLANNNYAEAHRLAKKVYKQATGINLPKAKYMSLEQKREYLKFLSHYE